MSNKEFEDISISKWKFATNGTINDAAKKVYRVFKSEKEFVVVEAESATEAAVKSGYEKVILIRLGHRDDMTMLDRTMLASEASLAPSPAAPVA